VHCDKRGAERSLLLEQVSRFSVSLVEKIMAGFWSRGRCQLGAVGQARLALNWEILSRGNERREGHRKL
jgi:hypothetical protein